MEQSSEVVAREDLQQLLWNGTTFVDFEHGLNAAVNKLRQTLGDSAEVPRYVETLPGRGYRFIGEVKPVVFQLEVETISNPGDNETTTPEPSGFWTIPRMWSVAALGIVLLAATGIGVTRISRDKLQATSTVRAVRFRIPVPEGLKPSTFALSPDGQTLIYYAMDNDGKRSFWVQTLDSLGPRMLPAVESIDKPLMFWAPDNKSIAFNSNEQLRRIDLSGSPPRIIGKVSGNVLGGSWNRDGMIVFGTETSGIMRIDSNGGDAVPVTARDSGRIERVHAWPTFLPAGRHFLYLRLSSIPANSGIFAGSLDAKPAEQSLKLLVATPFGAQFIASPDGNGILLFQRENTLFAQDFDTGRLEPVGEPRKLAEQVGSIRAYGYFAGSPNVLIHRNGLGNQGQLTWFNRDGKTLGLIGKPYSMVSRPVISPDGAQAVRVAFQRSHTDVLVDDFARDISQILSKDPAPNASPIWSPDGKKIVFSSGRSGHFDLYEVAASGGADRQLYASKEAKFANSWSSDGRFIFYTAQTGPSSIWALPVDPIAALFPLSSGRSNQSDGVISPDSNRIAYASDESGAMEIYVQPISNPPTPRCLESAPKVLISSGGGSRPRWRADGKELFYDTPDGMVVSVAVNSTSPLRPGIPKNLFNMKAGQWDVSADGSRFLVGLPLAEQAQLPFTVVLNWQAELKR